MLKGFKNFLMQGDLIIIAVGLVVALAFSTLIKAFTDSVITPLINAAGGGGAGANGLGWTINGQRIDLGAPACGIAETARVARYMAQQSSGQCGPCVFGLPAIAQDLALLTQGSTDAALLDRLARRLDVVEGRGACRHPDGLVNFVRSALHVFADDVAAHNRGDACPHNALPTQLRFSDARTGAP
jgi:hypothetical protein